MSFNEIINFTRNLMEFQPKEKTIKTKDKITKNDKLNVIDKKVGA